MMLSSRAPMRLVFALAVASLAAVVTAAPAARAQEGDATKAGAKEAFQAGVAEYGAGKYEEALAHFQEAQRLKPHPMVQVNIANCYDKLERPIEAIFNYERFLDSGVAKPEQRQEVTSALKRLRGMVGRLLLNVTPEGATVVVDGGESRRAPIEEPIPLKVGAHRVEARLEGYEPSTRELEVKGGAVVEIDVKLEKTAASVPATAPVVVPAPPVETKPEPPPTPPPAREATPPAAAAAAAEPAPTEAGGEGLPASVWIAGGVTAALAVGATVTGLLALDAETEFDNQREIRFSNDPALTASQRLRAYNDAVDAANRADGLALTTDILIGAAIVGAGITTYFLLTRGDESTATTLRPALARGAGGAAFLARF